MPVSLPRDPCYYYECSNGRFRLTYFIPPRVLKALVRKRAIAGSALDDFPDGVDLDCTEPDFAEFHAEYGYRPECGADSLLHAFYALYSSTRSWKSFRGAGFVPAGQLEGLVVKADRIARKAAPDDSQPTPQPRSLRGRRRRLRRRATGAAKVALSLRRWKVQGVDPGRKLDEQAFAPIRMERGLSAHTVFSLLHRRQKKA